MKSKMSGKGDAQAILTAAAIGLAIHILSACPAPATLWTDWTGATVGSPGSAVGTLGGITVAYKGELISPPTTTKGGFGGWQPEISFVGGTVTTSPDTVGDIIGLVLCQACSEVFRANLLPHGVVAGGSGGEAVPGDADGGGA